MANPVAKNLNKFNKPHTVRPKKGKGSYRRKKKDAANPKDWYAEGKTKTDQDS